MNTTTTEQMNTTTTEQIIPTGFSNLDEALGGGFRRGASTLLMGEAAAGITVLALNMATLLVVKGFKVVYITTEDHPRELEPKMVSALCEVPYEKIKDRVDLSKFNARQTQVYEGLRLSLQSSSFLFIHEDRPLEIQAQSDPETAWAVAIEQAAAQMGRVDYVIFDGLRQGTHYDRSVECLMRLAKAHNLHLIVTLRSMPPSSITADAHEGVPCVPAARTDLAAHMAVIVGITSLLDLDSTGNPIPQGALFSD